MNKFTEEQQAKGRKRFLAGHPEIKKKIEAIPQSVADALGITLVDLRTMETMKELREAAHAKNIDSFELFCSCIADTAEEFASFIKARDRAIQQAIGS